MKIHILGSGVMAKAMAAGLANSGFSVVLVSQNALNDTSFANELYGQNYQIEGKNIILAFKPYALAEVAKKLTGKANICISVLARTGLKQIKELINARERAICMPNLAAKHNASITPFLCENEARSDEIKGVLEGFGKAIKLGNESEFNAASIASGCAPAYLGLVAEALKDALIQAGIKANQANELISGTFSSTAIMLQSTHPALFKESICSPGGTTIEGIVSLEKSAVRGAMISAFKASFDKQNNA